jgi:hypothetical protein
MDHKIFHSLRCSTCQSSFKSAKALKYHLTSVAHRMAAELEDKYLSTREKEGPTSSEINMDQPDDRDSTNIVYTTGSSQNGHIQDSPFKDKRGLSKICKIEIIIRKGRIH